MIYCIGDSFTFGEELPSQDFAWPAVFSQLSGCEVINQGKPGTGNYRIVKRAMDAILNKSPEMIILGWTEPGRQEFADDVGIYDIWAGRNTKRIQTLPQSHRIDMIKYMTAYDCPEYYYAKWLRQIILIQALCKTRNVKCLMFNACGCDQWNALYLKDHVDLFKQIDTNTYVGWPITGMAAWCHNHPKGPKNHPLEKGHAITANKLYAYTRSLGWI